MTFLPSLERSEKADCVCVRGVGKGLSRPEGQPVRVAEGSADFPFTTGKREAPEGPEKESVEAKYLMTLVIDSKGPPFRTSQQTQGLSQWVLQSGERLGSTPRTAWASENLQLTGSVASGAGKSRRGSSGLGASG